MVDILDTEVENGFLLFGHKEVCSFSRRGDFVDFILKVDVPALQIVPPRLRITDAISGKTNAINREPK